MPVAQVDLAALRHNLELLRRRLEPGCRLLAAVKAGGYGHGAAPVARALEAAGVEWFGAATPEEALELREAGVRGRILLLGPGFARLAELVEAGVDLTVCDRASVDSIRHCGTPGKARVHLKADTGMGRIGLPAAAALELAKELANDRRLRFEGVWTHFAAADEADRRFTEMQIQAFGELLGELERLSIRPPLAHTCNSGGLLAFPEAHFDLVRPGIALYGYPPSDEVAAIEPNFRPVMTVTAPVTFVKRVAAGTAISYGATWRAPRETTVATVRFGYADGYPRLLANRGWARVHGRRCDVAGRICMDQLMLDVGDLDVSPGDRVTLFGAAGPSAGELGALAGTVSYEILTSVSQRVARVYLD
ncbi:MAG: alanine racemase [Trueperaceae bacterium]